MSSGQARIPVTIVCGFLGSGKTTLLNRVLQEAHGMKIAVIENEFGEVSIDDALLKVTNETIITLSNGCLCCTVNGDLVRTLLELNQRRGEFDHIIIETTGVANPEPVIETFAFNEEIAEAFEIDAVVALVDAKHIAMHIGTRECQQQIIFADIIVLNKLDLVSVEEVAELEEMIHRLNSLAVIHKTQNSAIALDQVLDQHAFSREIELPVLPVLQIATDGDEHDHEHCTDEHCHHDHAHDHKHLDSHHHDDDIQSVGFVLEGDLDPNKFNDWFVQLIQGKGDVLYRFKAILSVAGMTEKVIVQAVHRIVNEPISGSAWNESHRASTIVFIGKGLDKGELLSGLTQCLVQ